MKKSLGSLLVVFSAAFPGWALDWGLNINEVPLLMQGETVLYVESLKAKAWLSQPVFGTDLRFEAEGAFSTASTGGNWKISDPTLDLVEASLRGSSPLGGEAGVLDWDVGRRNVTDLTGGWVIGSRWDGAGAAWLAERAKLNAVVGYSGLLLKKTSKVSGSAADEADQSNSSVVFAPQRITVLLGGALNEVLWRQDLQTELVANIDLRTGKDSVHGFYATAAVTGPLPLGWRQKFSGTGALRQSPSSSTWSYLAAGELSAAIPFLGSRFVISGVAAQGFGGFGFQPVSGRSLGDVVSISTAQGAMAGAEFSLKPLPKTTVGLKGGALFRLKADDLTVLGLRAESRDFWLGAESSLYASWTPSSETAFGLNCGIFLPQSGAFVDGTLPTILAVVTATLKL